MTKLTHQTVGVFGSNPSEADPPGRPRADSASLAHPSTDVAYNAHGLRKVPVSVGSPSSNAFAMVAARQKKKGATTSAPRAAASFNFIGATVAPARAASGTCA